jgi:hypothetical protein
MAHLHKDVQRKGARYMMKSKVSVHKVEKLKTFTLYFSDLFGLNPKYLGDSRSFVSIRERRFTVRVEIHMRSIVQTAASPGYILG